MGAEVARTSFAGGFLTGELAAREDLAVYHIGVKEIDNFIVGKFGNIFNRPGIAEIGGGALPKYDGARLVPFIFSESDARLLVFYRPSSDLATSMDVYKWDGATYSLDASLIKNVDLPDKSLLLDMTFLQSADILYLFHQQMSPKMVTRSLGSSGTLTWSCVPVQFENGPFMDMNTSKYNTIWFGPGGIINWTNGLFKPSDVGRLFMCQTFEGRGGGLFDMDNTNNTVTVSVYKSGSFESMGVWDGTINVFRQGKGETSWTSVRGFTSSEDFNFSWPVNEPEIGTQYKFTFNSSEADGSVRISWNSEGGLLDRYFQIDVFTNSTQVIGHTTDGLGWPAVSGERFSDWALGSFSQDLGYPACGVFHQERLILASSPSFPQTLWMSKPASWHDFGISNPSEDTDAITATLSAKEINRVISMSSREDLMIMTSGAEFTGRAGSKSDVFTPSSISITPTTYHGSHKTQILDIGLLSLFVQKHGRVIRAIGLTNSAQGYNYSESELSVLAQDLFSSPVKSWAYQQYPWSIVWVILENGTALSLTLQDEHQVRAWSKHTFFFNPNQVVCIPGQGQDDVIFLFSNGTQTRLGYLKHREPDSSGNWQADTFQDFSPEMHINFTSAMETMQFSAGSGQSTQGKEKHIYGFTVRVKDTKGFWQGVMTENSGIMDHAQFPLYGSNSELPTPYTGDLYLRVPGGTGKRCSVRIEGRNPVPVNILGLFQDIQVNSV